MVSKKTPDALDIAQRQLSHAISLYMTGGDLVCAITLAGASEEILGRLVQRQGEQNSLERAVERKRGMFRQVFPDDPDPGTKVFAEINNLPRNMMKHLISEPPEYIDLDYSAGRLLLRAVENYHLLFNGKTPQMREFEKEFYSRVASCE